MFRQLSNGSAEETKGKIMQIILSSEEIETIYDALLEKKTQIEQSMVGRGQTMRTMHLEADKDEVEAILERFKPYVEN